MASRLDRSISDYTKSLLLTLNLLLSVATAPANPAVVWRDNKETTHARISL